MKGNPSTMCTPSMFIDIYTLPGSESQPSSTDWNRKLRLGQSRTDMGRHIVGTFQCMHVQAVIFGCNAIKKRLQVDPDIWIRVFLNQ